LWRVPVDGGAAGDGLIPRPLVALAAVPAELDVELRRALSTRPQNRPTSAADLLDAVRAAATGAAAPEPSETARLRPGPSQPADARSQQTPLAWAPTQAAPTKRIRRRWPWVAA